MRTLKYEVVEDILSWIGGKLTQPVVVAICLALIAIVVTLAAST